MKINESRKSTHSIMNNAKFGEVTIRSGNLSLTIPKNYLFKNGRIKKRYQIEINKFFEEFKKEVS